MPEPADRNLAQQLGAALAESREAAGQSRRDLARELGTSDVHLLKYEHGTANPTLSKVEDLAAAYGVRVRLVVESTED